MYRLSALACLLAFSTQIFCQGNPCVGTIASNGGRKVAIVIDSSGSMTSTDPQNLRITAGQAIVGALVNSDRVTVVDFDDSARIVSPLGPPSSASFVGIDSLGGTYIAGGVKAAIDELTKDPADPTSHVTGIVVLTDGSDSYVQELVDQLNKAAGLGIRVSFGFLAPDASSGVQDPSVLSAILATGGVFSTINDATAQANFISLVLTHGQTDSDNTGGRTNTLLLPGLATAGNVSASSSPLAFTYDSQVGEILNFTVTAISAQSFDVKLTDKTANKELQTVSTDPTTGVVSLLLDPAPAATLELAVSTTNTTAGLFSVSLISNLNRTISLCGAGNR